MSSLPYSDPTRRRLRGLLHRAAKDLSSVLRDRRCRQPRFCLPFFDLCDATAYEQPGSAVQLADTAAELARKSGDRHLRNRSLGVRVNTDIVLMRWELAEQTLEQYEMAAASCCRSCFADYLHRRADVDIELRRNASAMQHLKRARPELLECGDETGAGRALNLRAISHLFAGANGAAVEDAGKVLRTMPLESPQLYFRDSIGLITCFLHHADEMLDERALEHLLYFKKRLKGYPGLRLVRVRLRWLEGMLYARLGEDVQASEHLDRTRLALMKELAASAQPHDIAGRPQRPEGPPTTTDRLHREVIALTGDLGLICCRRRESRCLDMMLATCQRELTLDPKLERTLAKTRRVVERTPEKALEQVAALRAAVNVPIQELLTERFVGRERAAAIRRSQRSPSAGA